MYITFWLQKKLKEKGHSEDLDEGGKVT